MKVISAAAIFGVASARMSEVWDQKQTEAAGSAYAALLLPRVSLGAPRAARRPLPATVARARLTHPLPHRLAARSRVEGQPHVVAAPARVH